MRKVPSQFDISSLRRLPRNVWAVSLTSFFMDISTEMVLNVLPLFLANVLGVRTSIIGLIEGVAEATASLIKVFSGWLSDRLRARKWLAVAGYAISAFSKPFFYVAGSWQAIAAIRWSDRVGKGIRTAPRDALIADSIGQNRRGLAFGFQRAADTAGAMLGLLIALVVVWWVQSNQNTIGQDTFQTIVLVSLVPAFVAVVVLAVGAKDVAVRGQRSLPRLSVRGLGKSFLIYLVIIGIFDLGNSADAFLVLRAQERGMSVSGILLMLVIFNLIYTLVATPSGSLSDRVGRRKVILAGWLVYSLVYLGFALAQTKIHIWIFYCLYGIYYGLAFGTMKAMVADLVPDGLKGTAYGTYNAVLGFLDLPASVIAGLLWQGAGSWQGFGPSAPFWFGAGMSMLAAFFLFRWQPSASPGAAA